MQTEINSQTVRGSLEPVDSVFGNTLYAYALDNFVGAFYRAESKWSVMIKNMFGGAQLGTSPSSRRIWNSNGIAESAIGLPYKPPHPSPFEPPPLLIWGVVVGVVVVWWWQSTKLTNRHKKVEDQKLFRSIWEIKICAEREAVANNQRETCSPEVQAAEKFDNTWSLAERELCMDSP